MKDRIDLYYSIGKPYKIQRQGNSIILIVDGVGYYNYMALKKNEKGFMVEDKLPAKEVSFIGSTKRYIVDNGLHESIVPSYKKVSDIKFIDWNQKIGAGECFDNCFCIDINSAYWDSALMQGFIDDKIYKEGLTKDKRIRLACLGTFAKVISTIEFNGEKEVFLDDILPTHPHVFFNSANMIFKAMDECKKRLGKEFLFYWTDCVYVSSESARDKVYAILEKSGFKYKTETASRIVFTSKSINVNDKGGKDKKYALTI